MLEEAKRRYPIGTKYTCVSKFCFTEENTYEIDSQDFEVVSNTKIFVVGLRSSSEGGESGFPQRLFNLLNLLEVNI